MYARRDLGFIDPATAVAIGTTAYKGFKSIFRGTDEDGVNIPVSQIAVALQVAQQSAEGQRAIAKVKSTYLALDSNRRWPASPEQLQVSATGGSDRRITTSKGKAFVTALIALVNGFGTGAAIAQLAPSGLDALTAAGRAGTQATVDSLFTSAQNTPQYRELEAKAIERRVSEAGAQFGPLLIAGLAALAFAMGGRRRR